VILRFLKKKPKYANIIIFKIRIDVVEWLPGIFCQLIFVTLGDWIDYMLKLTDLTKTLSLRSIQLSATECQLLIKRAVREVAERSQLGAVIVPLCFTVAVITSGFIRQSPYTCVSLTLCMFGCAIARHFAITRIKHHGGAPPSIWIQVFWGACLGMAATWGITTAIFIYVYTDGFPLLLIVLFSSGIGAGSMTNFCIWRALAVNYLLLSFVPGIIVGFCIEQTEILPAIIGIIFFVFYLLVQVKRWNFHFWDSLITTYLFERQAEKLSETNTRLAAIVKKEQESRREVEEGRVKIRELFNLTNDAIVIYALDGTALDVNKAMLKMFSTEREKIIQLLPRQLFIMPADSKFTLEDHWEKALNDAEDNFECKVMRPEGQAPLLVHVNLRRVTWQDTQIIFVTLRDITARKQMEDVLKITQKILSESEGYLQAILRNVELPIYCKDLNGCYLTVNKPFEQLCCHTIEELRGKNDFQVFEEKLGRFFSFRDAEIAETGESMELEGVFTLGGKEKNLLVHKFPLKKSGGSVYATAGICTDVTTMKKALQTAQLANEAKSEFLANMSHELRTPMHSILSVARLGLKRVNSSPRDKLESYFEMIITSGDQLLELLSDLLDLSTLESSRACYNLREYDLAKDLEKVVDEFKVMMAEQQIFLDYESLVEFAPARYDKTKIYQVLRNLLANAMKFTTPGTDVKVVLTEDYMVINGTRQVAWKVMVIDQGVGLEKDELQSVFGKFVKGRKTSRGAGGIGLGLSICKRIIEDHQGTIWAEQNEYGGTTFCFLLPVLGLDRQEIT